MKTHFTGTARMVFDYIIRMTYGFHKKSFKTTHYEIAKALNLKRPRVSESISWLSERNMINGTEKRTVLRRCKETELSIQKDYDKWLNGTEKRTVYEMHETVRKSVPSTVRKSVPTPNPTIIFKEKRKGKTSFSPPAGKILRENGHPWIDSQAWDDFVQHRSEIKKPLTELAVKKSLDLLGQYKSRQREIIDNTIRNRWTGIFKPKGKPAVENEGPRYRTLEAPND